MDKPQDEVMVYPMTDVKAHPAADQDALVIQFGVARQWTPPFSLTRQQATDLVGLISRSLTKLDAVQATGEGTTRQ